MVVFHIEKWAFLVGIALALYPGFGDCANILGFLPFYGKSHNLVTLPYFEELADRGHKVTLIGTREPRNVGPNMTFLKLNLKPSGREGKRFDELQSASFFTTTLLLTHLLNSYDIEIGLTDYDKFLEIKDIDVVVLEYFESELFLGFVSKFNVPIILIHTSEAMPWHRDSLAEPLELSYKSHYSAFEDVANMGTYRSRLLNTLQTMSILAYHRAVMVPLAQATAEKFWGPTPPLVQLAREASLFLVNTHFSFIGTRPMNPSTIEIGGINIFPPKELPQDLQTLMDNAKDGVIFFSMGSVLKGTSMSDDKRDAFLRVFAELKEIVLWKWEGDLPNKPANLHTSPWFPQRDIFAHPNLKLFIGHCGLLGVHEAITEALPIICLPMFGDQPFNAAALKRQGFGLSLEYASITEEMFRETINRVLKEPSFKENAKRVSAAFKDRPMSAMDTAVYWTEYVIRHKGAPHLKSPARYMAWWEYHNVDVLATIAAIVLTVLILLYKMTKSFLTLLFCRRSHIKVKTS
ncbi:glucuronosyltransferase [Nesidiocoris tenuis]|uniref:Glucuronosyltransferase n=1 Tax=Nesidiocoris tenuis TaxID=355587 RepID=A0ABN7AML6_9HEMI|nr:glucuronosyltransferase [Nesidiocoris tenuis]